MCVCVRVFEINSTTKVQVSLIFKLMNLTFHISSVRSFLLFLFLSSGYSKIRALMFFLFFCRFLSTFIVCHFCLIEVKFHILIYNYMEYN